MNTFIRNLHARTATTSKRLWSGYRARAPWQQALIALLIVAVIGGGITVLAHSKNTQADATQVRTVTLESVGSLSGNSTDTSIVGSVRSVTQADLLAQSGGTVSSVHTTLGARVPAGFVIADLDNASQSAAVLQAEGAYDSAIAARNITTLQSGNTQNSFSEAQNQARNTYRTAFSSIDTALSTNVDTFFGAAGPIGPDLLISQGTTQNLSRTRQAIKDRMDAWRTNLAVANTTDPTALLNQASTDVQFISDFLVTLSDAANQRGSGATPAQLAALAAARGTVDAQANAISAARDTYNTKKTAAATAGSQNSQDGTQLAASNASVKSALGALRAAQANYEKTRIRATIGGTINYLPIKTGQYVNAFEKVATVANNGALEIVAFVPEEDRASVSVGMKVTIEGTHTGTITAVAPALDPTTKQIEIDIAVDAAPDLVNGQAVRITLPGDVTASSSLSVASTTATSSAQASSNILLPLTAVKLLPDSRAVFTVDSNGLVVAHTVTIGDVVGDRIEVTTGLTADMRIVTDVRGISEGQKVQVGDSASTQ